MRYLARISYDGSKFLGFQRQNNGCGVQNELERVLSIIAKKEVVVKGAGRTDAGVHALDQCVHFDFNKDIFPDKLCYVMNRMLSKYIHVNSLILVGSDFHARFDVKEKEYCYKLSFGEVNPFLVDYVYYTISLDMDKMREVANLFVGAHNFHNFVSGERDCYDSIIKDISFSFENDIWIIKFKGKGFYRYMVRSLVGAMIDVGRGKSSFEEVKEALENSNVDKRFFVAPACGLYLAKISY